MDREKLLDVLTKFFGTESPQGSMTYELTRVKEAFGMGTMTFDDFEEWDDEMVEELADYILEEMKK